MRTVFQPVPVQEVPKVQPASGQPVSAAQPASSAQPGINNLSKDAELPPPRPLAPAGPGQIRLPRLPGESGVIGATPKPTAETLRAYAQFVAPGVSPGVTLDCVLGRPQVLNLKEVPKRVQLADQAIVDYCFLTPLELSIVPRDVGCTVLNMWFADPLDKTKDKILSYLVRVVPDPEWLERMERVYKALEIKINSIFLDSRVSLVLAGEKLMVCGQAKDVAEANHIMDIVRSQAPGAGFRRETGAQKAATIPVDRIYRETDPRLIPDGGVAPGITDYPVAAAPLVVNMLRVMGEQQVTLHVTIAEVNRAAARTIGVNFSYFNHHGSQLIASHVGGLVPTGAGASLAQFNPVTQTVTGLNSSALNNLPAAVDNGQLQLAISALRELNYSRILAEPALTTMNGQPARFHKGNLFPIPQLTGIGSTTTLEGVGYIPVGVVLNFTPTITDKDRIRLQISAEVSERDPTLGSTIVAGSEVPILSTSNFADVVELREGQTLAVAGMILNRLGANSSRVPLFGDVPFFGRLFSFDQIAAQEQELVILVTPELAHPMEPKQIGPLPGSDLFEPGDFEFYLCGRIESLRSCDYRSPVMTDIHRMIRYHRCEQVFIEGPFGHCGSGNCGGEPTAP